MGDRITDELRKVFDDCTVMAGVEDEFECVYITKSAALACLDDIDAAHEKAMSEQLESLTDGMESMTEKNMAKDGWAKLPVDADGEVIHIGDEVEEFDMRVIGRARGEVVCIAFGKYGASIRIDTGSSVADLNTASVRHCRPKPTTVEDILQEYGDEVPMCCDTKETIIEFANRIREAVRNEQQQQ